MVSTLVVSAALSFLLSAKPDDYTEKSLCDLWAGAQCHATSCKPDAKERCQTASRHCRGATRSVVPKSKSERVATCAKAILKGSCGDPEPAECTDVQPP